MAHPAAHTESPPGSCRAARTPPRFSSRFTTKTKHSKRQLLHVQYGNDSFSVPTDSASTGLQENRSASSPIFGQATKTTSPIASSPHDPPLVPVAPVAVRPQPPQPVAPVAVPSADRRFVEDNRLGVDQLSSTNRLLKQSGAGSSFRRARPTTGRVARPSTLRR